MNAAAPEDITKKNEECRTAFFEVWKWILKFVFFVYEIRSNEEASRVRAKVFVTAECAEPGFSIRRYCLNNMPQILRTLCEHVGTVSPVWGGGRIQSLRAFRHTVPELIGRSFAVWDSG